MAIRTIFAVTLFTVVCLVSAPETARAEQNIPSVEQTVRAYFADIPVLIEIARCESGFRQFGGDGAILRGGQEGGMIGVFQFYEAVHGNMSRSLGYDLHTLEGNLAYAKHLYDALGTAPWNSAKSCWNVPAVEVLQRTLSSAERDALLAQIAVLLETVAKLQAQLLELHMLTQR